MSDPLEQRKKLSFEQAADVAPLPAQLKVGEISQEFRAVLWSAFREELNKHKEYTVHLSLGKPWSTILAEANVWHDHRLDEFPRTFLEAVSRVQDRIAKGSWSDVLGWLEWVFKHPSCPARFPKLVDALMAHCRLAYRVFDSVVICPIGSETEREAIERAFADLATAELHGARAHLGKAAEQLTAGHYADSVRESIHAVEATARVLEPKATLSGALARLEGSAKIHKSLKIGFEKLYGYSSDEKGIRAVST
jgi:hypothetical protein